jgi:hypothetical protein
VNRRLAALALALITACAASNRGYQPPPVDTPEQAIAFLEAFGNEYGAEAPPAPAPVASLPEVADVIRAEAIHRYGEARAHAEGATGVEALSLRSLLELTWAEALRTVRDLIAEQRVELKADLRQLELRSVQTDEVAAERQRLEVKIADFGQAQKALDVLAKPHLEAGDALADEVLRRHPTKPEAHFASAYRYRLRRKWPDYGNEERWLSEYGYDTMGMKYLRALVELERGNRKDATIAQLETLTEEDPGLVRAQSQLVLLYDDIEDVHAELVQLRMVSDDHFLVRLMGRSIDEEWESSREMRSGPRAAR